MLQLFLDKKYWFRQKRYGMGSVPNSWQGWAFILLYALFIAGMAGWAVDAKGRITLLWGGVLLVVTLLFTFICWKKTEGGWRWRWGSK